MTVFDNTVRYRPGVSKGDDDYLSRVQQPATSHDRSGSTLLCPPNTYLFLLCMIRTLIVRAPRCIICGFYTTCPPCHSTYGIGAFESIFCYCRKRNETVSLQIQGCLIPPCPKLFFWVPPVCVYPATRYKYAAFPLRQRLVVHGSLLCRVVTSRLDQYWLLLLRVVLLRRLALPPMALSRFILFNFSGVLWSLGKISRSASTSQGCI